MNWFYESNGAQKGPVTDAEFDQLIAQGIVLPTTLVWREGFSSWTPLAQARPSTPPPPPLPGSGTTQCDSCGRIFPATDLVPIAGRNICASCKPAVLQSLQQSGADTQIGDLARTGPAWELRETLGFFPALRDTVKGVLLEPGRTFATMRLTGGLGNPFLYNLLCAGIANVIASIFMGGAQFAMMSRYFNRNGAINPMGTGGGIIFGIIWSIVAVAIGIFIQSAVIHVCLMITGGARRSFEATFRTLCYASGSAALFNIIPLVGWAGLVIWGLIVTCIGLTKTHETELWRVIVAILLPAIICCGLAFAIAMIAGGVAGASRHMH